MDSIGASHNAGAWPQNYVISTSVRRFLTVRACWVSVIKQLGATIGLSAKRHSNGVSLMDRKGTRFYMLTRDSETGEKKQIVCSSVGENVE